MICRWWQSHRVRWAWRRDGFVVRCVLPGLFRAQRGKGDEVRIISANECDRPR